jgi:hypothetical protein
MHRARFSADERDPYIKHRQLSVEDAAEDQQLSTKGDHLGDESWERV